jgi:aconitate hydratase
VTRKTLGLDGSEVVDIRGIATGLQPLARLDCEILFTNGERKELKLLCRLDTRHELDYYRHGGLLHYVLRQRRAKTERSAA